MADPKYSLRIVPGVFKGGQEVTVRAEYFELKDTDAQIKLVEVDEQGANPTDIATFKVQVKQTEAAKAATKKEKAKKAVLRFTAAARTDTPPTAKETSPVMKVKFEGLDEVHEVAVVKSAEKEGPFFEVAMKVLDAAGKELFPGASGQHPYFHCSVGAGYAKYNCDGLNFHNDSAVIQSDGAKVLAGVLEYAKKTKNPGRYLLILGHTDAQGSDELNDSLSDHRARATYYLLSGNRQGYIDVCTKAPPATATMKNPTAKWCMRDVQDFMKWVNTFGWVTDKFEPGATTSDLGSDRQTMNKATAKALLEFDRRFQTQFKGGPEPTAPTQAEIAAVKTVPDEFWGQMFDVYSDHLRTLLSLDVAKYQELVKGLSWLPESKTVAQRAIGCGERYKLVKTEGSSATNRRIEFLFFEAADKPESLEKDELGPLYDKKKWRVDPIDCFDKTKIPPIKLTKPSTKDVLFVLDVSGSMNGTDGLVGTGASRLARVKAAFAQLIPTLPATALVNAISFTTGPPATTGATPPVVIGKWNGDALTKIGSTAGGQTITAWVDALTPSGATPTGAALKHALTNTTAAAGLTLPEELTVYVLSDGAPFPYDAGDTDGSATRAKILSDTLALRQQKHPKWKIDACAFINGGGAALTQFMIALANQNGGIYTGI